MNLLIFLRPFLLVISFSWLLLVAKVAEAQNPGKCFVKDWEFTYGGDASEHVGDAIQLNDTTYVLVGGTSSSISSEVTQPPKGFFDAWVQWLNEDGTIQQDKRYGGTLTQQFNSVARTNDGGLIFAGHTTSPVSGDVSEPNYSSPPNLDDHWVVKTTVDGTILWDKRYGGSGQDLGSKIIPRADGTYYLLGSSNSPVSGNKTTAGHGDLDYWVLHIDAVGNVLWDVCLGGSLLDEVKDAHIRSGDTLTVIGQTYSPISGNISQAPKGTTDFWVVDLAPDGTIHWEKRFGGSAQEIPYVIASLGNAYMIAGSTNSPVSGDVVTPSFGSSDGWILGIDFLGNVLGTGRIGGSGVDIIYSAHALTPELPTSEVVFGGRTNSPVGGTITSTPRGGYDYWLSHHDAFGNPIRDTRCGSAGDDYFQGMLLTDDGEYLMYGHSASNSSADKHQDSRGSDDRWVVRVDQEMEPTWYADADGDGKGDPTNALVACEQPPGYVANANDCDDTDPMRYINAPCNDGDSNTMNDRLDANCNCVAGETGCLVKEWEFTYGGDGNEVVREALQLNDSTYILAGETGSSQSGEVSEPSQGSVDAWVVSIDTAGTVQWDRRYGGNASENFSSVAKTNDGGLIFAGLTRSGMSGDVSQPSYSPNVDDIWVVRTDASGNIIWDKRYGGSAADYAHKIIALSDGTFYICGSSNSPASGNKSAANIGDFDPWFLHIDATGGLLWDVAYGGTGFETLEGATVDAAGMITAVSTTYSQASGNISLPQRGSPDMWVVQLSPAGSLNWERRYGGTGQEFAKDIIPNGSGHMLGGSSNSPISFEVNTANNGLQDGWVLQIDAAGVPMGGKHHGGSGFDQINAMAPLAPSVLGSDLVLAGYTGSPVSGTVMTDPRGRKTIG